MANEQLLKFLRDRIAFVRQELQGQGWSDAQIVESFATVAREVAKQPAAAPAPAGPPLTASKVLLFVGGLIILIAGIIYITLNWDVWTPLMRILAIALPNGAAVGIGATLWGREGWKRQAMAFLIVGALMLPLTLSVANMQFDILTNYDVDVQGLVLSLAVFGGYIILGGVFRDAAWDVLAAAAALVTYGFALSVADLLGRPWTGWFGFIPAIALFAYGATQERRASRDAARGTLLFGVLALAISLLSLGANGNFLRSFLDVSGYDRTAQLVQGWSWVCVALIAWSAAALFTRMRLEGLQNIPSFFRAGAVLAGFSGIWMMGLNGFYPAYETFLLVASLSAIAASVPLRSQSLLYGGTLFLVVYIFGIGGEYFHDQVGWPLTLFIAGLLSMGAGLGMERIRRRLRAT